MIDSKMCNDNSMSCENNQCWYNPVVEPKYSWFNTNTYNVHSCSFNIKPIVADEATTHLFGTRCTALDEECRLHDSIIIWNKKVKHDFPFNRIETLEFQVSNNLLINESVNLLLQIKDAVSHCGTKFLTTEEGIYLIDHNKYDDKIQVMLDNKFSKVDQKALVDLQLADLDFASFKMIKQEINTRISLCYLFMINLYLIKSMQDKFYKLYDNSGKMVIV